MNRQDLIFTGQRRRQAARPLSHAVCVIAALFAASGPAFASVPPPVQVNFSGGSGSPLTITLPQAITYTVTNDTPSSGLVFPSRTSTAPLVGITGGLVSGSLSYTINGGAPTSPNRIGRLNNRPGRSMTTTSSSAFGPVRPVAI